MAAPHDERGGPRGGRGDRGRLVPQGCDHRRAQTGSGEPQNEQRAGLRLKLSSRSFPPEALSSATDALAGAGACVTD